jgi:hypothetical protein
LSPGAADGAAPAGMTQEVDAGYIVTAAIARE